jgi:hypothetical protein
MSEPLGDRRKPLDNLLQNTVEEHNQQADELLGVFQRDFPGTYRLLAGSRFQVPVRRQADYMNWATHGLTKMHCCLASNASRPTRSTKKSSISPAGCCRLLDAS